MSDNDSNHNETDPSIDKCEICTDSAEYGFMCTTCDDQRILYSSKLHVKATKTTATTTKEADDNKNYKDNKHNDNKKDKEDTDNDNDEDDNEEENDTEDENGNTEITPCPVCNVSSITGGCRHM